MKGLALPKIGARNLKTALAVTLCIGFFELIHRQYPFYACIAAVICMKDTVENSYKMGKSRMIGTVTGGLVGLALTFIALNFNLTRFSGIITGIGIVITIYLLNVFNRKGSVSIACIVLIAIMTNLHGKAPYAYAVDRIIDTFIGIIIALLINNYIYKYENKVKKDLENIEEKISRLEKEVKDDIKNLEENKKN
ncbi:aromatic acid exporter family protein [Clostridium perfringens]|uniref:FUSC family protein n=1 Tax=Clostridium perfringens TaxID=1502 RepID=UPI002444C39F|nr:aromatic acid exporter family protein [Clostridium perfringens]MDG6893607.1 Fusaric acid resistance protein family protein [Clostridium perfringens]MDK0919445.1 aromatic acid exporter family protein [Clostridium perfringens]MDK0933690.1 aromatic acid exporter family protein [Clostridium perfringens]MDM0974823.1 aromatic acid exporter family protein [Clostridium perfringens]